MTTSNNIFSRKLQRAGILFFIQYLLHEMRTEIYCIFICSLEKEIDIVL